MADAQPRRSKRALKLTEKGEGIARELASDVSEPIEAARGAKKPKTEKPASAPRPAKAAPAAGAAAAAAAAAHLPAQAARAHRALTERIYLLGRPTPRTFSVMGKSGKAYTVDFDSETRCDAHAERQYS